MEVTLEGKQGEGGRRRAAKPSSQSSHSPDPRASCCDDEATHRDTDCKRDIASRAIVSQCTDYLLHVGFHQHHLHAITDEIPPAVKLHGERVPALGAVDGRSTRYAFIIPLMINYPLNSSLESATPS